ADDGEGADLLGDADGVGSGGHLVVAGAGGLDELPSDGAAVGLEHRRVCSHELVAVLGHLLGRDLVEPEVVDRALHGARVLLVVPGHHGLVGGDASVGGAAVVGPVGPQRYAVRRVDAGHHDAPGVVVAVGRLHRVGGFPRGDGV